MSSLPCQNATGGQTYGFKQWLEDVAVSFEIALNNIIAIVHDNIVNIVAAGCWRRSMGGHQTDDHPTSVCYTLQLAINASLKHPSIESAIGAVRFLMEHFKNNELAYGNRKENSYKRI